MMNKLKKTFNLCESKNCLRRAVFELKINDIKSETGLCEKHANEVIRILNENSNTVEVSYE